MRIPLILSFGLHFAVFLIVIYGIPSSSRSIVAERSVIDVTVIATTAKDKSNAMAGKMASEKLSKARPKPPALEKQTVALKPELTPKPVLTPVKLRPRSKPNSRKAKRPKANRLQVAPRPKPRPKPKFASMMLKTVQKLKDAPTPKPKNKKESFNEKMLARMNRKQQSSLAEVSESSLGEKLSISEIGAIKRQIERCWFVPAAIGAKDVGDMLVQIHIRLNPDGTLRKSQIVDRFLFETNAAYKAVAESALRAVRNPQCNKFKLPLQKYNIWKDIVLRFNPSDMVGR